MIFISNNDFNKSYKKFEYTNYMNKKSTINLTI